MRCSICDRPLLHCAVPGIAIGPTCAKKRGLAPKPKPRRASIFSFIPRRSQRDEAQIDWVNQLNAGLLAAQGATA
jgi:hypothetical protein